MNPYNRFSESQGSKVYPIFNNRKRPRDPFTPDETDGTVNTSSFTAKNARRAIGPPIAQNFVSFGQRPGGSSRPPTPQTLGAAFRSNLQGTNVSSIPSTSRGHSSVPKQWVPFRESQMQPQRFTLPARLERDPPLNDSSTPKDNSKVLLSRPTMAKNTKPPAMCLISATIHGVREWSQYKEHLFLLFEIIGIVDSAVSRSANHLAKQFVLCDSSSTIDCRFYEIDRELPNVIRRQWYRCIGKLDKHNELFHCISLRPATIQEQQLFPKLVETSTREMRMKIMRFVEP